MGFRNVKFATHAVKHSAKLCNPVRAYGVSLELVLRQGTGEHASKPERLENHGGSYRRKCHDGVDTARYWE
jgi:hypothetical protein